MPTIDPTAWIAPSAVVIGDVTLGPGVRILHGAVLNAARGPIAIGEDVVVMEHALLRGRPDHPLEIGDAVDRHDEIWPVQEGLDFPMTMYGVPRGPSMREIMRRQSAAYGPNDD